MRKLPLIDFQHNRAMLHHIDNNFVSLFSSNVPPFHLFWVDEKKFTSLYLWLHFSTNEPSLIECASHHILSDKFCSIASLSTLIYYYIVISLHNNIYWSTSSSLLVICVSISPLADVDLTLSLRSSFLFFVVDHDICAAKDSLFLSMLSGLHFYSFVCCVFSHVCRRRNPSPEPRHRFRGSPTLVLGAART